MNHDAEETVDQQIVRALATAYRQQGYHQVGVPASYLLTVVGRREQLTAALGDLLTDGTVVAAGAHEVALHPSARVALLGRPVLEKWLDVVSRESGAKAHLYREGIQSELQELVTWAVDAEEAPAELIERAAELAGVLATTTLDPRAITIVATHGGTPRGRLKALAHTRPRSVDLDELRDHLRHTASTVHPTR
jgi:hypothetical protein